MLFFLMSAIMISIISKKGLSLKKVCKIGTATIFLNGFIEQYYREKNQICDDFNQKIKLVRINLYKII